MRAPILCGTIGAVTSQSSQPSDPDVGPAYAGAADAGIRSSVPPGDPMRGDALAVVRAEYAKIYDLFGDLVALLDNGRLGEVQQRWFGVIRETLEFQAACQQVVVPEVADAVTGLDDDAKPAALVDWLRAYDELNPDLQPDEARTTALTTVEALEAQERALVPAVEALPADVRNRLGEDLRQVMG
jgi:hypothetical protein